MLDVVALHAPPEADVEATSSQDVEGGALLREPDRIVERKHVDEVAHAHVRRALRERAMTRLGEASIP
jgi:hypothetical protein